MENTEVEENLLSIGEPKVCAVNTYYTNGWLIVLLFIFQFIGSM